MPLKLAAAAGLAVCLSATAQAAPIVGRLSYHWAPSHESAKFSSKFAEEVTARSKGRLKIEVFPSGQLFTIRQIVGALSSGAVELGGVVTFNQFPTIDRDFNIVEFPNFFKSIEDQRKFFKDTPEGKALWDGILKKTGLVQIAYVPVGPYVTWSTKSPMDTVASMRGLKARSLAANERPGFRARGMDVVSLSTEQVYTALQNGMIDTLSTVPTAVKAYSWWDYLKYGQLPYMVYADASIMANARWFNSLPPDLQKLMLDVGNQISKEATDSIMASSKEVIAEFVKRGGHMTVLKGKQLAAFEKLDREKTEPQLAKMVSPEILAAARRYIGRQQ